MDYKEFKCHQKRQNEILDKLLTNKLHTFKYEGFAGLPTENVRLSPEYRAAKNEFSKEFKNLRNINAYGNKYFKKEIAKDNEEKRKNRICKN